MMLRRREWTKKPAVLVTEDQPLTLSNSAPGRSQKRLAVAVLLAFLTALFLSAGGLSNVQLGRVDAFVPVYGTAIFVNDLITSVLLFNQFAILRSRALLAISSAYLFTALMVIPWTLTFRGCLRQAACSAPACRAPTGSTSCDTPPFQPSSWHTPS